MVKLEPPSRISLCGYEFSVCISKLNEHVWNWVLAFATQNYSLRFADSQRLLKYDKFKRGTRHEPFIFAGFVSFVTFLLTTTRARRQQQRGDDKGKRWFHVPDSIAMILLQQCHSASGRGLVSGYPSYRGLASGNR